MICSYAFHYLHVYFTSHFHNRVYCLPKSIISTCFIIRRDLACPHGDNNCNTDEANNTINSILDVAVMGDFICHKSDTDDLMITRANF